MWDDAERISQRPTDDLTYLQDHRPEDLKQLAEAGWGEGDDDDAELPFNIRSEEVWQ